jgi:hypothetical protein
MEANTLQLFRIYITNEEINKTFEPSIDIEFFDDILLISGLIRKKTKTSNTLINGNNFPVLYEENTIYNISTNIFRNGEIIFEIKINPKKYETDHIQSEDYYFRIANIMPICKYKHMNEEILIDKPYIGIYDIIYNKVTKKIEFVLV